MSHVRLACQAWSGEATQQAGGVLVVFSGLRFQGLFPNQKGPFDLLRKYSRTLIRFAFHDVV